MMLKTTRPAEGFDERTRRLDPLQEEVEAHLNDLTAAVIGDTGLTSWLPCELGGFCVRFQFVRKQEPV